MNLKEKGAAAILGVVALYAIAVATWFMSSEAAWKKAAKRYDESCKRYDKEERLIKQRNEWNEAYESEKQSMPTFKSDLATDTTWLRRIEDLAKTNHVLITQISSGKEVEADDVLELPIEVRNLEGSLESLVHFMHALETTDEGMFDIKSIDLQPNKSKRGYLKGSMSITCAYLRSQNEE